MQWIIYKMVQPDEMFEMKANGYYRENTDRNLLERLRIEGVVDEHPTFEMALSEIENQKHLLKTLRLTIIPVIDISFNGKIY
jgi:hypothetical protein